MYDNEPEDYGFVTPWFLAEADPPNEDEYFSPYHPVADELVMSAKQDGLKVITPALSELTGKRV